jgi:hypothetical protein
MEDALGQSRRCRLGTAEKVNRIGMIEQRRSVRQRDLRRGLDILVVSRTRGTEPSRNAADDPVPAKLAISIDVRFNLVVEGGTFGRCAREAATASRSVWNTFSIAIVRRAKR